MTHKTQRAESDALGSLDKGNITIFTFCFSFLSFLWDFFLHFNLKFFICRNQVIQGAVTLSSLETLLWMDSVLQKQTVSEGHRTDLFQKHRNYLEKFTPQKELQLLYGHLSFASRTGPWYDCKCPGERHLPSPKFPTFKHVAILQSINTLWTSTQFLLWMNEYLVWLSTEVFMAVKWCWQKVGRPSSVTLKGGSEGTAQLERQGPNGAHRLSTQAALLRAVSISFPKQQLSSV